MTQHNKTLALVEGRAVPQDGHLLGRLVALDDDGKLWAQVDGLGPAPVAVCLGAPLQREALLGAIADGRRALFVHAAGLAEPVLLTLLVPQEQLRRGSGVPSVHARDGALVLRAGKASITLRRDGKVHIRGVRLVTRSEEDTRLVGRTIRLN